MKILYVFFFVVACPSLLLGQATGDYRTAQAGNWNAASTWERYQGVWQPAVTTPTSADGAITISHEVVVPTGFSVTIDQVTINGHLLIQQGAEVTLADGPSTDLRANNAPSLTVNGTFIRNNGSIINNLGLSTRIVFGPGSGYRHLYTSTFGDLPQSTWDVTSTIFIEGFNSNGEISAGSSWAQGVGNVVYNCPGQLALVDFAGFLSTIFGDFTILSTGSSVLQLSTFQEPLIAIGSANSQVGGDLTISGSSRVIFATEGSFTEVNIYGNWNYSSSNLSGSFITQTGQVTVNLEGDFNMTQGRLYFADAGTTGVGTLNAMGNFFLQGGRIEELGDDPSEGNINFNGNTIQTLVNTGTFGGRLNFNIPAGKTLDLGTYALQGAGNTSVEGTVILRSLDNLGALQLGTTRGNIRTSTRSYGTGATIVYAGAGQQFLGNGNPTTAGVITDIDNTHGVLLVTNITSQGIFNLGSGNLDLNGFRLTSSGSLTRASGNLAGSAASQLIIEGTSGGSWGELAFDPTADTLGVLEIDRTGTDASVTLMGTLTVLTELRLINGNLTNSQAGGLLVGNGALVTRYNASNLLGQDLAVAEGSYDIVYRTHSVSGGPYVNFTTARELSAGATDIRNFTIFMQSGDVLALNKSIVVNGNFNLNRGLLQAQDNVITMRGATWSDNSGNLDPISGLVIFDGNTTIAGTSTVALRDIQLNSGRTITLNRSWTLHGHVTFQPGSTYSGIGFRTTLAGADPQTISAAGATFDTIRVAKTAAVEITLASALNLSSILEFAGVSQNVNFNSNGYLTLLSTSDAAGTGTASIYRLSNGNTVTGSVTVQRYMSGEGRIYRYISSPVSNATVSQWKDDFSITGVFQDPSPRQLICGVYTRPSSPSLFYYNEAVPGSAQEGYVNHPGPGTSSTNSPLEVGRGYAAYIRQCTVPTVIDVSGLINQGEITFPVTYTISDSVHADGWNLVGNPYPATIDWDGAGWTKTNISTSIAITDNGTGFFRYYDSQLPGMGEIPNGYIAPGQGFWVRATALNPVLRVRENAKERPLAEFFREGGGVPAFALRLKRGEDYDIAYVKLVDQARSTIDDYDAPKMMNESFSFYTLSEENISMAINALEQIPCNAQLQVGMEGMEQGQYIIDLNTYGHFPGYKFLLVDKYLGQETELGSDSYAFTVTKDGNSAKTGRFVLKIEEAAPDLFLRVTAPVQICDASAASIVLATSETDVTYSVWTHDRQITKSIQGTGEPVVIQVAADSLHEGNNELFVKAQKKCSSYSFAKSFPMEKIKLAPPVILTALQCNEGPMKFETSTASGADQVYWFEKETDSLPIHIGHTFELPALKKNKAFYVAAFSSATGCYSQRVPAKGEIVALEPASIQLVDEVLLSNHAEGNQWYYGGEALEGGTTASVRPELPGLYKLVVTSKGCSSTDEYEFSFSPDENISIGWKAYPNPVSSTDKLQLEIFDADIKKIEITSTMGKTIKIIHEPLAGSLHAVEVGDIAAGLYLVTITRQSATAESFRLIKQ